MEFSHLPGEDLVGKGLRDLAGSTETDERLARDDSDSAHSRYNALVRRLASFESALECVGQPLEDVLASRARPGEQETPS